MTNTATGATANGQRPTANALYHEYIDYYNRLLAGQIEPDLDIAWQARLMQIFSQMSRPWCERVAGDILQPKGIHWDRSRGTFSWRPVNGGLDEFAQKNCHPSMRPFAEWCINCIAQIEALDSASAIADLLENAIAKINSVDVGNEVDMLISRSELKEKFIRAAGAAIKRKTHLKMPASKRGVDEATIKSFINEVFLKQQLLDFRFHVVRQRQLRRMQHPLLNTYLSGEQSVRRLEVVRTTQYIFALASSHESEINLFSVRRFLNEENISVKRGGAVNSYIYYNGVAISEAALDNANSVAAFKTDISSIISIANQISPVILELLESMEEDYDRRIRPDLFRPLEAYNIDLGQAVEQKLRQYEKGLLQFVLERLEAGVTQKATHADDFNYLSVGIRQLMSEAIADFDSFQKQPAVLADPTVERMMMRLQAYVRLLGKRSSKIFNKAAVQEWDAHSEDASRPVEGLRDIVRRFSRQYVDVQERITDLTQQLEGKESFVDRLLRRRKMRERELDAAQLEAKKIRRASFLELTSLFNQYRDEVLHLEHKSVLFIKRLRTYAVCSGSNGVSELPALFALPENYNDFDPANYSELTAKVAEKEAQEAINDSVARDVRQRQSKLRSS
ncbi:MAG: hypothetical protein IKX21_07975 [Deltaproteobacteria bacterium]|nr:hypothetical protein [Deltaproteobacteria bacterium]